MKVYYNITTTVTKNSISSFTSIRPVLLHSMSPLKTLAAALPVSIKFIMACVD